MKTKLMLSIAGVALVTLSFTFASVEKPKHQLKDPKPAYASPQPGGLVSDEVVK